MRNIQTYLLASSIITLLSITNEKALGQLNNSIIGADTICIGQSSMYSVNISSQSNNYLFRDTVSTGNLSIGDVSAITNTFSYDLWVKPTRTINMYSESSVCSGGTSVSLANSNQNWAILATSADWGKMCVGLTIGTNGLMVGEHSQNILESRLSYNVPITDWVHVAVVYRTDSIFLYLNGNMVRSRQIPCTTNIRYASGVIAGSRYSPEFKGNIDEYRLWDIALTPLEVKNIKDKKLMNQVSGLRYYASFDNGKFEKTLGDIGTTNMLATGLSPISHLKSSSWDLDKYTGTSTNSLTSFSITGFNYLWSTGSTTNNTAFTPIKGANYLFVKTFKDSYSNYDTITIIGKDCGGIDLSSGLIAYYPFNGNANDESGNGNNGIVKGAELVNDRFGKVNSAYRFNGVNTNIDVEYKFGNQYESEYTVAMWVNAESEQDLYAKLLSFPRQADNWIDPYHGLGLNYRLDENDSLQFEIGYFNDIEFSGYLRTNQVTPDKWQFLVFTFNDSEMNLYVDNELIATGSLPETQIFFPNYGFSIGSRTVNDASDGEMYKGIIDDIRLYNRELSRLEQSNLFFGGNICTETVYDTVQVVIYDTVTKVNNNIQYIKFESYYSADDGQVNVYDLKAYSKTENIALNKPVYVNSGWNESAAVDNDEFSRWEGNRDDAGPDSANPHFIVVDLQNITPIDSIILNIKGFDSWKQVFDLSVSSDSIHWSSIGKGDSITGIFTYIPDNTNTEIVYDTIYSTIYNTIDTFNIVTVYDTLYSTIYNTIDTFNIITVYDTIPVYETINITVIDSISVTDTLIINAIISGLNSGDYTNTIKVYPNPTKDYININTGNYSSMTGYKIQIVNLLGTTVFETLIEQPLYEINLSSWTGKGLYFIKIIDDSEKIIDIRKIVLQ